MAKFKVIRFEIEAHQVDSTANVYALLNWLAENEVDISGWKFQPDQILMKESSSTEKRTVRRGGWICIDPNRRVFAMADGEFRLRYEP